MPTSGAERRQSTPKKPRRRSKSGGGGEDSSAALRSLLGVTPAPAEVQEAAGGTLSLQEVIRRVAKPCSPPAPAPAPALSLVAALQQRPRSHSASEALRPSSLAATPAARARTGHSESTAGLAALGVSPQLKKSSPQLKLSSPQLRTSSPKLKASSPQLKSFSPMVGGSSPLAHRPVTRESTPESDQGYTSLASTSPDYSLAELVRAMQVSGEEPGRLAAITEVDPAVSQAVRSSEPCLGYTHPPQGPNLLQTLLGLPAPHPYSDPRLPPADPYALERAAKQYRGAAAVSPAACTWSGQLPPPGRGHGPPLYSAKVFLGGVPWDLTEKCLAQALRQFGPLRVEWPGKGRGEGVGGGGGAPKGYVYVVLELEGEGAVPALLARCTMDYSGGGGFYYRLSSRRNRAKEVQVIPWLLSDSNFVRCSSQRLDPNKTVFVGALHGVLTAEGLATVFHDLFGSVVYAGIDTDRHKYPIGSGRVTFSSAKAYMKAVSAAFIEIKTVKFNKKVQVDPYLEDALCCCCMVKQGPYFCRDLTCFSYFCRGCWELQHGPQLAHHKPIMRNTRGGGALDRPVEPAVPMGLQAAC